MMNKKTKFIHIKKTFDLKTCFSFISDCCKCPQKKEILRSDLIRSSEEPFRLLFNDVTGLSLRNN